MPTQELILGNIRIILNVYERYGCAHEYKIELVEFVGWLQVGDMLVDRSKRNLSFPDYALLKIFSIGPLLMFEKLKMR